MIYKSRKNSDSWELRSFIEFIISTGWQLISSSKKQATCSCSVENLGIICALTSLYRGQKYKRSPFRAAHIYEMRWVFGLLDAKSVPVHAHATPSPPGEVGTKLGLSFFFLYVLTSLEGSTLVCCTIHFMTTTCFQAILQTAIEINLPMFSFRMKEGRRSMILLSFFIYTHLLIWHIVMITRVR